MVICRLCNEFDHPVQRVYYRDPVVLIEEFEGGLRAIYHWHETPKLINLRWVEMQMKIVASRKWNREWSLKFDNNNHPHWIAKPLSRKRRKTRDKNYSPMDKIGDLDG